jgi:DNA-binding NarL/FixJ family response regulator
MGKQQTNKYFHTVGASLRLVDQKKRVAQETPASNPLPVGRRSTDRDSLDLYDRWLSLSARERQVTYLTCMGYKNAQIAFQIGIGEATVKTYLQHVFYKMDVRSKADLRLKFVEFDFNQNPP